MAYSLLGMFDVYMPLIYGEGRANAVKLREIHKALSGDGSWHTVVLHGLGRIGKTQLAITYAKRHKDNYSAIFWLNIKDEDSLRQSFAAMARQILQEYPLAHGLSTIDMKNLDNVIDAVKVWLSLLYNTRWLMIYNKYDNPRLASNKDPAAVDITKFLQKTSPKLSLYKD
jgi:hypothetical protein